MSTPPEKTPDVPGPTGGYRNAPVSDPPYNGSSPSQLPPLPTLDGSLVVDFSLLAKAGGDASSAAATMDSAWQALSAVALFGAAPWGDDAALGQGFDQAFAQPRDDLLKAVQALPATLRNLADALGGVHSVLKNGDDTAKEIVGPSPSLGHGSV